MIDANGNWTATIPSLTGREDGHEVTATVTPNGVVTYAVDDGDGGSDIGNEMPYDGVVCAYLVERLTAVTSALAVADALISSLPELVRLQPIAIEYKRKIDSLPPWIALP